MEQQHIGGSNWWQPTCFCHHRYQHDHHNHRTHKYLPLPPGKNTSLTPWNPLIAKQNPPIVNDKWFTIITTTTHAYSSAINTGPHIYAVMMMQKLSKVKRAAVDGMEELSCSVARQPPPSEQLWQQDFLSFENFLLDKNYQLRFSTISNTC